MKITRIPFFGFAFGSSLFASHALGEETKVGWMRAQAEQQMLAYKLAECVVGKDPAIGPALLATRPGSAEEVAVNRRLDRPITACWTGNGSLKLGQMLFRGAIAEVLYRQSDATLPNPYASTSGSD